MSLKIHSSSLILCGGALGLSRFRVFEKLTALPPSRPGVVERQSFRSAPFPTVIIKWDQSPLIVLTPNTVGVSLPPTA